VADTTRLTIIPSPFVAQERDRVMLHLVKEFAALAASPFVVVFVATGMPPNSGAGAVLGRGCLPTAVRVPY
jgi:hypothetical protein